MFAININKLQGVFESSPANPDSFGVALAKTRTKFQKRMHRTAFKFLKKARSSENNFDFRPRVNRAWMTGANLQPVIDFLSKK